MSAMAAQYQLHNSDWADAIPASLARGRSLAVARQLAGAHWLLRRKSDGCYLATANRAGELQALLPLSAAQRHALQQLRSEEHTSELQSLMRSSYAVFCLKKNIHSYNYTMTTSL